MKVLQSSSIIKSIEAGQFEKHYTTSYPSYFKCSQWIPTIEYEDIDTWFFITLNNGISCHHAEANQLQNQLIALI